MKASRETKRLFVGGLGQSVSEADLQSQFSRFGDVSDVEIITRKDDQGKFIGFRGQRQVYRKALQAAQGTPCLQVRLVAQDRSLVEPRTSAAHMRGMSVLNNTKWKGGTLQIQLAKESFLHRLAREREEAQAKNEESVLGTTTWLEKTGTVDFHMKAVPGTEVPGHRKLPATLLSWLSQLTLPGYTMMGSNSEDADSLSESAESEEGKYNAMMKNCLHVTLSLADLGHLAGSDLKAPKEDSESGGWETTSKCNRASKSHGSSGGLHGSRQCIYPEEIVASLLEGEENTPGKQKPKENNLKLKFQAFKGVGCLYGKQPVKKSLKENVASSNINKNEHSLKLEDPTSMSLEKGLPYSNGSSSKLTPFQGAKKADDPNYIQPQKRQFTFKTQNHKVQSPSSSEKGSRNPISSLLPLKDKKPVRLGAETSLRGFDEDCCHGTTKTGEDSEKRPDLTSHMVPENSPEVSRMNTQGSKTDFPFSLNSSSDVFAKDKHAEDNQKRLSALEARQKAKEVQKKLVHNALANLDGPPEDKPTHIIFGSDSEIETEETSIREQSQLVEKPVKEVLSRASGTLFGSSSEEESDPEEDRNRFRIKPQFEGRAGQKLMNLQSHFGTDDRFRMDSRFLESDSEEEREEVNEKKTTEKEELAAEKLKALNIVQSILQTNLSNSTSKGSVPAKKFKDIIHYDPTRHDHANYEKKRDDKPKESKAMRKKKREEAEKLPVVSKEMYYDITMDLKEIFQTTKDSHEKKDAPYVDCDEEKAKEVHVPAAPMMGAEQPSGFTFSFFDSDTKDVKEETYRVETVKPGRTAWQVAPRFQDSSSEEDDVTEETDDRKSSPGSDRGWKLSRDQITLPTTIDYSSVPKQVLKSELRGTLEDAPKSIKIERGNGNGNVATQQNALEQLEPDYFKDRTTTIMKTQKIIIKKREPLNFGTPDDSTEMQPGKQKKF
ncbi:Nucleolar protein 8 [Myotis davidii]|uniref:Nucleolar protein 8 n=1 Tax=Myotis davidii TaxID=225400 RepID=L5M8W4_MYODS|nr:Nucleolar protein 8 [Myotis davidii]